MRTDRWTKYMTKVALRNFAKPHDVSGAGARSVLHEKLDSVIRPFPKTDYVSKSRVIVRALRCPVRQQMLQLHLFYISLAMLEVIAPSDVRKQSNRKAMQLSLRRQ